jgi:hypothetical protein
MWNKTCPFHRVGGWTIEDEQCQKIGGGYKGSEVQIFTVSLNGANVVIYADPESNVMKAERNAPSRGVPRAWC